MFTTRDFSNVSNNRPVKARAWVSVMKSIMNRMEARLLLIPLALLILCVGSIQAQDIEEAKLIDPNGVNGDGAGWRVEVWGNYAFVSALYAYDSVSGTNCGAVHVYKKPEGASNGWEFFQTLYPSNPSDGGMFGWSMDVYDGLLIVGSRHGDGFVADTGAAYIFEFDDIQQKWDETAHLFEPNGAANSGFGVDVAINDEWAVVGIQYNSMGTVALFRWDDTLEVWVYNQTLDEDGNQFGVAVDIWNDTIVAGADVSSCAYVYTYDESTESWGDAQSLSASSSDHFGGSLCLNEGILVIGAHASGSMDSGKAYIYEYDNTAEKWTETQGITASDPASFDYFASTVAVSVNTLNGHEVILVGAPYRDSVVVDAGAVYVFERIDNGDWTETRIITARDAAAGDQFGLSVAVEDSVAVIGAWQGGAAPAGTGFAYLYRDACWAHYGQGFPGSSGNIPELELSDDPILGQTVDLILGNSLGQDVFSLLFFGDDKTSIGTPFGGTLLVDSLIIFPMMIPGSGLTLTDIEIPADQNLSGVHLYLQLLQLESSSSPKVVSFSKGLDMLIGAY